MGNGQSGLPQQQPQQPAPAPEQQRKQHGNNQRYTDQSSRIVVDIRGAESGHDYNVWVKQSPSRVVEHKVRSVTNTIQNVGGVLITLLTIQKLWEEIRFWRVLRRDLDALAGTLDKDNPTQSSSSPNLNTGLTESLAAPTTSSTPEATTWANICGLSEVKMLLQEVTVLPILRPDLFQGIRQPPRGILLFGPPGSGKTMLAKAVATESRATFFAVTGSSILSKWYGQSEQNVKALFEKARKQQPSVIFIDEVDSLMGHRSDEGGQGSSPDKRLTNEFLAFIDGIQTPSAESRIIIIAATNHPWGLDEAALSRFARRIYVPLPDKASRAELLKKAMAGLSCDISDDEYLGLAEKCSKYSNRDLVHICREASMRPLRELWGRRILESSNSPNAAQQQRLVAMIANNMGSAPVTTSKALSNRKRVRRELERWKRQHKADWCNIDAIMEQAEKTVAAKAGRSLATTTSTTSSASLVTAGSQPGQGTQQAAAQAAVSSSTAGPGSSLGSSSSSHSQDGAGSSKAEPASSPKSPSTPSTGTSRSDLAAADQSPAPRLDDAMAHSAAPESDSAAMAPSSAAEAEASARGGVVSASANAAECNNTEAAPKTAVSEITADPPGAVLNGDATNSSIPSAADEAAASTTSDRAPAPAATTAGTAKQQRRKGSAANNKAGANSSNQEIDTWTVDELLNLSAAKARAVKTQDFEDALKQIMGTEFDLTSKYEEWNNNYGSGTDNKRDSAPKWMGMYG